MRALMGALGLIRPLQACQSKGCVIAPSEPDVGHAIRVLFGGGGGQ